MLARLPAVAGSFYPDSAEKCRAEISEFAAETSDIKGLNQPIVAGIVPHAGWTFSGNVATMVFSAIAQTNEKVDTFVIFGAAHHGIGSAAVYDSGNWETPMGKIEIDADLAKMIIDKCPIAKSNIPAHDHEHSIEVQVPIIQYLFGNAKILPIIVPPADFTINLGKCVAECIKNMPNKKIICIGSTDLTHYGPRYGFNPMGDGPEAIEWASNVNDQMFIDAAIKMDAERIIEGEFEHMFCCGAGAAAASITAAKALGKTKGKLLAHTNSNQVMRQAFNETLNDSVGYAGIVYYYP